MALLSELFGIPEQMQPPPAVDDADLLRRALQLNRGVTVAPRALETQAEVPPMPPVREVQDYPVAAVGEQMPTAAAMPAPPPQAQPRPPQQEPTLGDRFGRFLMAGSQGSLARGVGEAFYGADRAAQNENMTVRLLTERGVPADQALAISRNPAIMQQILPQVFGPKPANMKLAPGEKVFGPKGEVIASNSDAKTLPGFYEKPDGSMGYYPGGPADPDYIRETTAAKTENKIKDPPAGYEWVDPRDPSKGVAAIAGGPATKGTGEMAGKLSLMRTARDAIEKTRPALEKAWGVTGAAQNAVSDILPFAAGDIGEASRNVRLGIEAALRTMTGAAAPEAEVGRYMALFMPNARDNEKTAKQKLDNLTRFMDEAEAFARQGHLTRDEMGGRQTKAPMASSTQADPLGIR